MGNENPICTLGDYSKPSHEGYMNTIELPVGNSVVPLQFDNIWLMQNGCSFHELQFKDPNQHLNDFLKLVDSLDLDGENRERTRLRLFQFSLRNQATNWLERLPTGFITTWEDLTTHFLAQFFLPGRTVKLRNDIMMFQQHHEESLSEAWTRFKELLQRESLFLKHGLVSRTYSKKSLMMASIFGSKSKSFMIMLISPQDEPSINQPVVVRLSKFEADFKQQQGEMTNKINTVLKAITDQITGALLNLTENPVNWDKPPKNEDGAWHAKIRLIDPDGEEFTKTFQSIPTSRKLSEKENPRKIIDLDHFHDT
nr:zinc finger, CCHC-type [Tanacetum cinerariifolium]